MQASATLTSLGTCTLYVHNHHYLKLLLLHLASHRTLVQLHNLLLLDNPVEPYGLLDLIVDHLILLHQVVDWGHAEHELLVEHVSKLSLVHLVCTVLLHVVSLGCVVQHQQTPVVVDLVHLLPVAHIEQHNVALHVQCPQSPC